MTTDQLRDLWLRWCRGQYPEPVTPEVTAAGLLAVYRTPEHAIGWLMRLRSRDPHFHAAQALLMEAMRRDAR
jgi:hypothetical protein